MSALSGDIVSSPKEREKQDTKDSRGEGQGRKRILIDCVAVYRHVNLCRLPEKREKKDSRGDERVGQGTKKKRNESEETRGIKTFPLYPYLLQG